MKKKLIILSGDPNSINSEIIFKCWSKLDNSKRKKIYLISNYDLIKEQFKRLNYKISLQKVKKLNENTEGHKLKILNIDLNFKNPFKVSNSSSSIFVKKSLNFAHKICLTESVAGMINCPIRKELLNYKKLGVTEYLASKCKIKNNSEVMLIKNKELSVSPITTHIDLKNVSRSINKKIIITKLKTINSWFLKNYKRKPKIAVLGLNPHNAELHKDSEEIRIIIPIIKKLKKNGFSISGPLVADTIFISEYKKFDVIVGMYHDQILAPFKAMYKFDAINLTLGLKYHRASPDHGVAENLILKKKANPLSLMNCIKFFNNF